MAFLQITGSQQSVRPRFTAGGGCTTVFHLGSYVLASAVRHAFTVASKRCALQWPVVSTAYPWPGTSEHAVWKTRCSPRTRMLTRMLMVQMSKHMDMQSRRTLLWTVPYQHTVECKVWSAKCVAIWGYTTLQYRQYGLIWFMNDKYCGLITNYSTTNYSRFIVWFSLSIIVDWLVLNGMFIID